MAEAANDSEQLGSHSSRCDLDRLRPADIGHTHGLATLYRRTPEERLPVLHWSRVQLLSHATREQRPVEVGAVRTGGARCAGGIPRHHACRPVRPRLHARNATKGTSEAQPRRRSALSTESLRVRTRTRRVPFRPVREDARAPARGDAAKTETQETSTRRAPQAAALKRGKYPYSHTTPSPSPSRMYRYAGCERGTGAIPCRRASAQVMLPLPLSS